MCVYFLTPTAMSHTILQDIQGAHEDRTKYTFPMVVATAASRLVVGILIQGYSINRAKVRPRTDHKSPEREYSSTLSLTSALHWGGWMDPRAGQYGRGNFLPLTEFDPRTVQPVVSRYNDYESRSTGILTFAIILRPSQNLEWPVKTA
jgi:hypothetical protein